MPSSSSPPPRTRGPGETRSAHRRRRRRPSPPARGSGPLRPRRKPVPERGDDRSGDHESGGEREEERVPRRSPVSGRRSHQSRQRAADHAAERAAAVDHAGGRRGAPPGAEVDRRGTAGERVGNVDEQSDHEQRGPHRPSCRRHPGQGGEREAGGHERDRHHRKPSRAEQPVARPTSGDDAHRPRQIEQAPQHAALGHVGAEPLVEVHRCPEHQQIAERLDQQVDERDHEHRGGGHDLEDRVPCPFRLVGDPLARHDHRLVVTGRRLGRGEAHVLGPVGLEGGEHDPDHREDRGGNEERHPPASLLRRHAGHDAGDHAPEREVGAPQPHHATADAPREELAHVLRERRPAARLKHPLDREQQAERGSRHRGAHRHRSGHAARHAREHHAACAQPVAEHAPEELSERIGDEIAAVDGGERLGGQPPDLGLLQFHLCHGEAFSRQVEARVGEPGGREHANLPAGERAGCNRPADRGRRRDHGATTTRTLAPVAAAASASSIAASGITGPATPASPAPAGDAR